MCGSVHSVRFPRPRCGPRLVPGAGSGNAVSEGRRLHTVSKSRLPSSRDLERSASSDGRQRADERSNGGDCNVRAGLLPRPEPAILRGSRPTSSRGPSRPSLLLGCRNQHHRSRVGDRGTALGSVAARARPLRMGGRRLGSRQRLSPIRSDPGRGVSHRTPHSHRSLESSCRRLGRAVHRGGLLHPVVCPRRLHSGFSRRPCRTAGAVDSRGPPRPLCVQERQPVPRCAGDTVLARRGTGHTARSAAGMERRSEAGSASILRCAVRNRESVPRLSPRPQLPAPRAAVPVDRAGSGVAKPTGLANRLLLARPLHKLGSRAGGSTGCPEPCHRCTVRTVDRGRNSPLGSRQASEAAQRALRG